MRDPSGSFTTTGPDPPKVAEVAPTRRPIRISTSRGAGVGALAGRLAGMDPDVQLASAAASSTTDGRESASRLAAVITKFQLDLEILAFEKCDDGLQLVA